MKKKKRKKKTIERGLGGRLDRTSFLNVVVKRNRRMKSDTTFQDNKNELLLGHEFKVIRKNIELHLESGFPI